MGQRSNEVRPSPRQKNYVGVTQTVRFSVEYTTMVVPSRQPCNAV